MAYGPEACRILYARIGPGDNNGLTDKVQCFSVLLCGWLGAFQVGAKEVKAGRLLTIEEVGGLLRVPVNLKDQDAFHLSIEEYLQSLISLVDELVCRPFHHIDSPY